MEKRDPALDEEIRQALIGAPRMSEELGRRIGAILWPVEYED